jgi:hypothetical protein
MFANPFVTKKYVEKCGPRACHLSVVVFLDHPSADFRSLGISMAHCLSLFILIDCAWKEWQTQASVDCIPP